MPRKLPYREGQAFEVTMRSGNIGIGVIARMAPKGKLLLGYFFRPNDEAPDRLLASLRPSDAVMVGMFGDLHLFDGKWKVIGDLPNWDRSRWPVPEFMKRDPLGMLPDRVVVYDDDDISKPPKWQLRTTIPSGLADDGLMGAGYVELKLQQILDRQ